MEGISAVWDSGGWESEDKYIHFRKKFDEFLSCMLQSTRNYQTLKIHVRSFAYKSFFPLHKFQSVTELILTDGYKNHNDSEDLVHLVNGFHNLKVLESNSCLNDVSLKLKTKKLKKLIFNWNIPSFQVVPDLECLSLCSQLPNAGIKAAAILSDLPNLEKLELDGTSGEAITESFVSTCNFKLKEFNIFIVENNIRAVPSFIKSQPHLENLNLDFPPLEDTTDDEVFEMFYSIAPTLLKETLKLKNLEFLRIDFCNSSGIDYDIDDDAPTNQTIKRFKVEGIIEEDSTLLPKMIERMPNLKELSFKGITYHRYPLNSLKMLEKLRVDVTTKDSILTELQLPNLMEASFENIGLGYEELINEKVPFFDTEEFIKFLKNHPNLKMLKIRDARIKQEVWKYIKENMHLETLKIVMGQEFFQEMPFLCTDSQFQVQIQINKILRFVNILVERIK